MIKGNRILFGYGTISVGVTRLSSEICFEEIKPPKEVGSVILREEVEIVKEVIITDTSITSLIGKVTENNKVVEKCGYIFDFTNYNEKSVEVFESKLRKLQFNLLAFAC